MADARTPRKHPRSATPSAPLKPKIIALSVAAAFALSVEHAGANPTGPTVVSGSAAFAAQGNALNVTNSANAIINWQGFSIGANEITRFIQPNQLSAVLNRVIGTGGAIPQSVINGVLTSNGHVYLLNPRGVIIGAGARINAQGFIASSLDLSNEDFLAGKLKFNEVPGAGAVKNQGTIDTGPGGRVYLVGSTVENSGIIRSPEGDVVLAAGKTIELVSESSPYVSVRITADNEQAKNLGTIIADSGRIGIQGAIVTQGGVAEASGAMVGPGGEIRLVASKDVNVETGSHTAANGNDGGKVVIQADTGTAKVEGTVEATGSSGNGGTVQALGVRVGVLGNGIIDASGETGGGTVLVGGDYKGKNADVQNSQQTVIGSDGVIRADARNTGNGGRVIAWSDGDTAFYGKISARGGGNGGDGGFVETSGKRSLQAFGRVDVSAPKGKGGNWLLDPYTLNIVDGPPGTGDLDYGNISDSGTIFYGDAGAYGGPYSSEVSVGAIASAISGGNVLLQAQDDLSKAYGNVNFNNTVPFDLTAANPSSNDFEIWAAGNIDLKGRDVTNSGGIDFEANYPGFPNGPTGTGSIVNGGGIMSVNGNVLLYGQGITAGKVSAGNTALLEAVGGSIRGSGGSSYDVSAPVVELIATGSIGTPGAPLQVQATSQLVAYAQTGIDLVTNQYNPQVVNVATLQNVSSGNINLTAYGGATIASPVYNAGGDVTIQTASPLQVLGGIDAVGNILLVTAGTGSNDMYLDYSFLYSPDFTVTVGPGGVLTLGPNFQGPITKQTIGVPSGGEGSATGGELLSQISQTTGEVNNSVNFDGDSGVVGDDDKKTDKERKLPSCKG
jgi:filamentous hemagglutinin family protein